MALKLLGSGRINYLCLSTDIADGVLTGVGIIGGTVFTTDTGEWYIVTASNTVALDLGASIGLSSSITQNIAINTAVAALPFDMSNYIGGMVITPTAWTAANIGFYVCDTVDGTYVIAKDKNGIPIQISTVATGAAGAYAIPVEIFSAKFVKLWSKNTTAATETDVNQAAARILRVMIK